ncbi:hypothetical protein [Streptomyces sp. NBC_00151]|uniref:hypothetical protein n=1 Tax=Streptomyces sp. NBC_00151 TaxID=2975669 RepID=UPI002DDAB3D0|nr:hypothetical protein [Streptomyces sp. NBC_00151]WRZ37723.1 hypothetical protein OG915_06475 [Streptomyces sp. NBC_00151]
MGGVTNSTLDLGSGQMPGGFPHALAADTTFTGRLDGSGASLTAEGSTTDGVAALTFTFDGTAS